MRGVTLKAPINEFSGGFFVTNSTDGELHDFWITEHCSEHRNVLMGQLPCNQPLCFKQWHSSLPVHNAAFSGLSAAMLCYICRSLDSTGSPIQHIFVHMKNRQ